MKPHEMTSQKPYIIRAIYEWIADNNCTPYIVIDINAKNVRVPTQYAQNGQIVLDISADAAVNLKIDNNYVNFKARFGGVPMEVYAPIHSVMAIYAHENGAGMVFDQTDSDDDEGDDSDGGDGNPPDSPAGKPKLTLVKS